VAQGVLEQHLHDVGQPRQVIGARSFKAVVGIRPIADAQHGPGIGRIDQGG